MKPNEIKTLNSEDYSVASKCLDNILKEDNLDSEDIKSLLTLNNKLIISDFIEGYGNFNQESLNIVEDFINKNLDHDDRLFVSDLIEFATIWNLSLNYKKCINFLKKYGNDEDYVLLAAIDYIFENLRISEIDEIYDSLYLILHNPESNQSAQVKAAFVLFRITGKKEFLADLIDLVINGHADNKLLLGNILSLKHNGASYFEYFDILKIISSKSE